jgi:spermidine synthase
MISMTSASGRASSPMGWLLVCFTCSGMSALIYEVAWVRSLELVFGATTFAVATVLAAFMGGLAFGSYFMGRLAPRLAKFHPLKIYAVMELAIGVLALVIPFLFEFLAPVYQALWQKYHASFAVFSSLRFLLCVLILLAPTSLMGATLPIMSQFVNRDAETGAGQRRIGLLYTVNTAGAVLGCLAAGFLLFPVAGLQKTQYIAVLLSTSAAVGAYLLAKRTGWAVQTQPASSAVAAAAEATAPAPTRRVAGLLVLIYAASGCSAMMYEVSWSRLLVQVLGSSTYAYTIMLATFLFGLALGAWLGTRYLLRMAEPLWSAGVCQLGVALTTYLGMFLVEDLSFIYTQLHAWLQPRVPGTMAILFLISFGLMILPTLCLGAMFPVAIHGLRPDGARTARVVGWAYSLNTLGAIGGSVAAGFWLLPICGTQQTLLIGVALNGLMAALAFAAARTGRLWRYRYVFSGLTVVFVANSLLQTPAWEPHMMATGIFRYVRAYHNLDRTAFRERAQRTHGEIVFFKEGITCNVVVFRTPTSMSLLVNGKPDASAPPNIPQPEWALMPQRPGDLPTQILLGQVPLLLAPRRDEVMVIGLGSGVTLGSVLRHEVKSVECVELEDAVVKGSQFFNRYNNRPLADPRVRLVVNDARNHLLVTGKKYDVVISEPSNPWIPGAAALFTREFFELARSRLQPRGVFCQWVQLYEMQPQDFQVILRSLRTVFPHVHIFRSDVDAILLATTEPLKLDVAETERRLTPGIREDFAQIGMAGVEDMLGHYWVGGPELYQTIPGGPINTDDNMFIEFKAPLRMLAPEGRNDVQLTAMFDLVSSGALPHLDLSHLSAEQQNRFWLRTGDRTLQRARPRETQLYAQQAEKLLPGGAAAALQGRALEAVKSELTLKWWEAAALKYPGSAEVWAGLAEYHHKQTNWAAGRVAAERLGTLIPGDDRARYLLGKSLAKLGQWPEAAAAFGPLLADLAAITNATAKHQWADLPALAGQALAKTGREEAALPALRLALDKEYWDLESRQVMAEALTRLGRSGEARLAWQRLGQLRTSRAVTRHKEARKAIELNDWPEAAAKLSEAYALDPWEEDVVFDLARIYYRQQRYQDGIELVERHLRWDKDKAWAVGFLGQLYARLGNEAQGKTYLQRYMVLTGKEWPGIQEN